MTIIWCPVAPEHSEQTKHWGGGGQAIDHKQWLPPPTPQKKKKKKKKKCFVSSERSGGTGCILFIKINIQYFITIQFIVHINQGRLCLVVTRANC